MSNNDVKELLTTRNVGRLSTFELRQELVARNSLDIPEEQINHKTMLQRLIKLLLEDEKILVEEKSAKLEAERNESLNKSKLEREKKKLEAIERSKLRQKNPEYFSSILEKNILPEKSDNLKNLEEYTPININVDNQGPENGDPFSTTNKVKTKIHIR